MKCHACGKPMKYTEGLKFNEYALDGWKCSCGEVYFNPDQAQKILILNKLKKGTVRAKLGKIRSNLILRLPKDIEVALNLKKGEQVLLKIEKNGVLIVPT